MRFLSLGLILFINLSATAFSSSRYESSVIFEASEENGSLKLNIFNPNPEAVFCEWINTELVYTNRNGKKYKDSISFRGFHLEDFAEVNSSKSVTLNSKALKALGPSVKLEKVRTNFTQTDYKCLTLDRFQSLCRDSESEFNELNINSGSYFQSLKVILKKQTVIS